MKNLTNLEIINISTKNGKLIALLSYKDTTILGSINNGYGTIEIPINTREIQLSVRGNVLVDQSIKEEPSIKES